MRRVVIIFAVLVALGWPMLALAQSSDGSPPQNDVFSSLFNSILNMPTIALYAGIMVVVGPFIIAWINRARWSSTAKLIVAGAACTAFSAGWFFAHGDIIPVGKWVRLALAIFLGATIMFHLMKPAVKEQEAKTG